MTGAADRVAVKLKLPPAVLARLDAAADELAFGRSKLAELLIQNALDELAHRGVLRG